MSRTRDPLTELTASAAVEALRSGAMSAETYASALLVEAEAADDLNAFISIDPEAVIAAARRADRARAGGGPLGALHGLPIAVKDSFDTADLPTTNGTAALRIVRPATDAAVVARAVDAGAMVFGKTNLTELSFGWTSNNGTFGAVRNPYDHDRVPGGSSGGSAAVVSARVVPLSLGADTLGSIRIPASFSGAIGFRPTLDRYPNEGVFGLTDGRLDQVGPFARSVADIALFDGVIARDDTPLEDRGLEGIRIGIPPFYFTGLDSGVRDVTDTALDRLRDAGAILVDADVSSEIRSAFEIAAAIMLFEAMPSVERYLRHNGLRISLDELVEQMHPDKRDFFTAVALPPGRPPREGYEAMRERGAVLREALRAHLADHGLAALVYPAVAAPPPPIGEEHHVQIDGEEVSFFDAFGRNTALAAAAGAPAITLPAGMSPDGMPVGLELAALPGADRGLLGLASAVEGVLEFAGEGRPVA